MGEEFGDMDRASHHRNKAERLDPKMLCPLLKAACNRACVCVIPPRIVGTTREYSVETRRVEELAPFKIADWECGNMMFFRECVG